MAQIGGSAGGGLGARVARGSAYTLAGFAVSNAVRLASNLILARLLFPEAFGIMALVTVLLVGLTMFSDLGITPAIQSSPRGDDPAFLNTAWTLQILRAIVLFAAACALAWPMAQVYGEPLLVWLIPFAALSLPLTALQPTRVDTAARHLMLGRLTLIDLASQILSTVAVVILAWATGSVWALAATYVIAALLRTSLAWAWLPGPGNRLQWERAAASALIRYGKWIFLSTAAGFLVLQGDKLVLGYFLSMEALGLYNIGYFLAGFPLLLGQALIGRMMIPIYRESPPAASAANFARLRRLRFALSALLMTLLLPLALAGPWIVALLYDPRYAAAGAVLVAVSLAHLPQIGVLSYDQIALASDDSRGFFLLNATRAALLMALMILLVPRFGAAGAAAAIALAWAVSYPLTVRLARRHGAWDGLHDATFGALAAMLVLAVVALHGGLLAGLAGL